jgi:hypothetical protein
MALPAQAALTYTEARLNLNQSYNGSTVELTLPNGRRTIYTEASNSDEVVFSRDHLASDGSIYFRREGRYPRSFLWRTLDDRRVLELQSVDLTQSGTEKTESYLTLRLRFAGAIRPFGVAFGDPDEKDALVVFVITVLGDLYTITLPKDVFIHAKATETLASGWCSVFKPSAFRLRDPYRLAAIDSNQLFVSLSDGDILNLKRAAGEDGE